MLITGDGINDVMIGTLFSNNYCYFLNGTNGDELESINYGTSVDAISAIYDIVGDASMEMIAGGRNGYVACYSGGLGVSLNCGDCNNDGVVDVGDIVYLVNYLYKGGPEPIPMLCVGNANGDTVVDIGDVVYIINYLFKGGPAPVDDCCS